MKTYSHNPWRITCKKADCILTQTHVNTTESNKGITAIYGSNKTRTVTLTDR